MIRMREDHHEMIREKAHKERKHKSDIVTEALELYFARTNGSRKKRR